jgi:tetratricopeptide (TPR) repeat protein
MRLFNRKPDEGKWEEINKEVLRLTKEKKLDEAIPLAAELFSYSKKFYGKRHEKTVVALNNLGYIYTIKKEFDEAESYLLLALQTSERVYGKYSREVAFVNMNLAKLYVAKATEIEDIAKVYEAAKEEAGAVNLEKA